MKEIEIEKVKYRILQPELVTHKTTGQGSHEHMVYDFWMKIWSERFSTSGHPPKSWTSDFDKQTFVTSLWHGAEIMGCHLYTIYDLSDSKTRDSDYFHYLEKATVDKLTKDYGPKVMTMEYLCTNPIFQRNNLKFSTSKMLILLGSMLAESINLNGIIGMPISDTNVSEKAGNILLGWELIQSNLKKYGYSLSLMASRPNGYLGRKDLPIFEHANKIWQSKEMCQLDNTLTAIAA